MYDRRRASFIAEVPFLFDATVDDGFTLEMQVNPEFESSGVAEQEAARYAEVVGRLPAAVRGPVKAVQIHRGMELFGAWPGGTLAIHTGQAGQYRNEGILDEALAHEAAHIALDALHASAPGWLAAQAADATFFTTYARQFPDREDIAESFVPYLAVRRHSDRISAQLRSIILDTIPNRITYSDSLALDWHPIR